MIPGMTDPAPALPSDPTREIIRLGIAIHRALGPGLLEAIYLQCLCWELERAGLRYAREVPVPVIYQGMRWDRAFRADLIVEDTVLVELKAVEHVLPVHKAQTLSYMRLSGCSIGLLMNFNVALLKDGLHRFIA
jgi:GxxExxY protein